MFLLQALVMLLKRTSFEAVIEGFEADAPAKWPLKGKSLPYVKLQMAMEDCCAQAAAQSRDGAAKPGSDPSVTDPFFRSLAEEVKQVDRCNTLPAYPVF